MSNEVGRPIEFKEEFIDQAYKLCLLGLTDKELGAFFGVTERTINRWKNKFPKFCHALRSGKVIADADVAHSLHKRALGFEVTETTREYGEVSKEVTKVIPPETAAAKVWLNNRQPGKWVDKRVVEHEGGLNNTNTELTKEERDERIKALKKKIDTK